MLAYSLLHLFSGFRRVTFGKPLEVSLVVGVGGVKRDASSVYQSDAAVCNIAKLIFTFFVHLITPMKNLEKQSKFQVELE